MWGAEFLNSQKSVTISAINRPLVYAFRGEVSVLNNSVVDRPAFGSITFQSAINTVSAPKIFLRLKSSRHPSMSIYMSVNGSPGNWTGFSIWASVQGGGTLPLYVIEYVVAIPSFRSPERSWGMQIIDQQNGGTLFSSDERVVRHSKFTKRWSLSVSYVGYRVYADWTPDVTIDPDDYLDTSFFNRGALLQWQAYGAFAGLVMFQNNIRTLILQTQSAASMNFDGPTSQNLCIAICKFPAEKYP